MKNIEIYYQEDQARHWCQFIDVYESHRFGHVPVPGADEEEPGGGEDAAVDGTERRAGHEQGDNPGHDTKDSVPESLNRKEIEIQTY